MRNPLGKTALTLTAGAAALVLASTGGAVAGSLITSAQIQDDSIRSVDVKNGTLNLRDIRPGARAALGGQNGADGTDGTDGAPGTAGPAGAKGDAGSQGLAGPAGAKGDAGAPGPQGSPGAPGVAGAPGADGADGADAPTGAMVLSTRGNIITLTSGSNEVAAVDFTAPSTGNVYISASAEFNANSTSGVINASLTRDGGPVHYQEWDAGDVDGYFDQSQNAFTIVPVTAGDHTFALSLQEFGSSYSDVYGAQIAVQFIPTSTPVLLRNRAAGSPNS